MIILENTETGETREIDNNVTFTSPWKTKGSTLADHVVITATDARGISVALEIMKGAMVTIN